jgi:hypothetical protein
VVLSSFSFLWKTSTVNFLVRADKRLRTVQAVFATEPDLSLLKSWQRAELRSPNAHARDAVEFAKLASKWWEYYHRQGASATSLPKLKSFVSRRPQREYAFLVLAKAKWYEDAPVLGLCCCRRTWCNHIVLEFAAVHPLVLACSARSVRGVGTGMLYSLIRIADEIKSHTVWGEATANSAPFYEKVLGIPKVGDHFFITGRTMDHCREQFQVLKSKTWKQKS